MRRVLATSPSPKPALPKPNVLMAIPYLKKNALDVLRKQGERINFLLDSGAFTAWKAGKVITLDKYCKFVEELPIVPFGYFTLDMIGDPNGTRANFKEIVRRGLNPIPIFTRGSPWCDLTEMAEHTDFIGVGGLVGTNSNKLFVRDVCKRIAGTKLKVHLLGFSDRDYIARWKPFSVDSSTANTAIAHGSVVVYLGGGRLKSISRQNFRARTAEFIALAKPFFEWCGEDIYHLRHDSGWQKCSTAQNVSSKAFAQYAIEAEMKFGTKVFIAVDNVWQLQNNLAGYRYCVERMPK